MDSDPGSTKSAISFRVFLSSIFSYTASPAELRKKRMAELELRPTSFKVFSIADCERFVFAIIQPCLLGRSMYTSSLFELLVEKVAVLFGCLCGSVAHSGKYSWLGRLRTLFFGNSHRWTHLHRPQVESWKHACYLRVVFCGAVPMHRQQPCWKVFGRGKSSSVTCGI